MIGAIGMPLYVYYEGRAWKIYYFTIDQFESELKDFLIFLDGIDKGQEEVVSVVPNTGAVTATFLMDSGFTGVKGFAVITKKRTESTDLSPIKVIYPDAFSKGLLKCRKCKKTFAKDYNKCPYCGSDLIDSIENV